MLAVAQYRYIRRRYMLLIFADIDYAAAFFTLLYAMRRELFHATPAQRGGDSATWRQRERYAHARDAACAPVRAAR